MNSLDNNVDIKNINVDKIYIKLLQTDLLFRMILICILTSKFNLVLFLVVVFFGKEINKNI